MDALERHSLGHGLGGEEGAKRGPEPRDIMYILFLLIFLQYGKAGEFWALVPPVF